MREAQIGTLEVSVIGVGCNNFGRALDQEESAAVVRAALDSGVTYFDTARNYGNGQSETFLGAAIGARRSEVVIATKFGPIPGRPSSGGAGRRDVMRAAEESLTKLGTDYIDLYQLHFPSSETPIEDTIEAMNALVAQGKVREIGCSNFDTSQLTSALTASTRGRWAPFVSNQVEYSLLHTDPDTNGLTEVCGANEVALLPYYPLACGLLTGKVGRGDKPQGRLAMDRYARFLTDENFDVVESLEGFARSRGLTVVDVALGWLLSRESVPAVTPGATRPSQVRANCLAAEWEPTTEDLSELSRILGEGVSA